MVRFALAFLLLAAAAATAAPPGRPPSSLFIEELTWTELRDAVHGGRTTVLVPIGGTEQNGPHMAIGKHNVRVRELARRIAAGLGNALVAPVLAYVPEGTVNPPASHMRFPGTITIPEDAFEKVLESSARGFRLHGFRDIVFLGDHGGYRKGIESVVERLGKEWAASGVRVHGAPEYYRAQQEGFAGWLRQHGYAEQEIGTHAGLADTSLMLAIDPSLVRADRLGQRNFGPADGVYGDPRRASAELGRAGVDLVVERTVETLRKATARR